MCETGSFIASEPAPAYRTNSYADVMTFLHSMPITRKVKREVAMRLVKEVSEPALADAFDKLDEIAQLSDGWAGVGSYAVSRQVINNLKSVLLISEDEDWQDWLIGPDVNATVGLQSKKNRAMISIGREEYSYYVVKQGERIAGSHVPFSPESFLETMRRIV